MSRDGAKEAWTLTPAPSSASCVPEELCAAAGTESSVGRQATLGEAEGKCCTPVPFTQAVSSAPSRDEVRI